MSSNTHIEIIEKDKSIDWYSISRQRGLSENFIRNNQNNINWCTIVEYQKLSEDFIREFQDELKWYYISKYQKLSEDFIREFQDKVDWDFISCRQTLSEDFIREFKDKVDYYEAESDMLTAYKNWYSEDEDGKLIHEVKIYSFDQPNIYGLSKYEYTDLIRSIGTRLL